MPFNHVMSHWYTSHLFSFYTTIMHHTNTTETYQSSLVFQYLSHFFFFFIFVDFFYQWLQWKSTNYHHQVVWIASLHATSSVTIKGDKMMKGQRGLALLKFQSPSFTQEPLLVEMHLLTYPNSTDCTSFVLTPSLP